MEDALIHINIEKTLVSAQGNVVLAVDTQVSSREMVALFGPSGAGKTTLLRILAGLVKPDKGRIEVGHTVWFDSSRHIDLPPQKRNIGYMFQDYALFPNMTVEENIRFAHPENNKKEVNDLIQTFGLTEFVNRKPSGLSGGQKQRVALARALARKPALMLLDEPLSALDAEMRSSLQNEIAKAHQLFGATTILVSHDMSEVFRLANKVICLEHGKVTLVGHPEKVFSNNSISGKFQVNGQVAKIEKQDIVKIVTVVTGNNILVKVIALDSDLENLSIGDQVLVFTKAFNPMIQKLGN
jgi:ABC-type sulfate/molybdate transport systems, ATPase component